MITFCLIKNRIELCNEIDKLNNIIKQNMNELD